MLQHSKSQHQEIIERVPNANIGRDYPGMRIFGMQGVPRIQIQSWISKQVNRYWGKIMEKKREKREIEEKEKQKLEQQ